MTVRNRHVRQRAGIPAAVIAVLILAGCTSGHIGDSWQCPLATGGACDSVVAADPAVPDAKAGQATALGKPLWLLPRDSGADAETAPPEPSCAGHCGFDPFGWLARLFAGMGAEKSEAAGAAPSSLAAEPDTGDVDTGAGNPDASQPETPATPVSSETATADGDTEDAADLRTGEAVVRIWIAPFVDGDGIYREAAWVRVVLSPAGWRLK